MIGLLFLALLAAGLAPALAQAEEEKPPAEVRTGEVLHLRIDSIIHPVVAEFIVDSMAEADASEAQLLVVELSTPGGLLPSTREMFTAMLAAETPVAVYVSPSGSQAASAGFFLLMAADVAAMAPGTNTGAAHPVGGDGKDIEGTMGEKVEQDSAATIRSLAERQGRNVEAAEAGVLESTSYSADEALDLELIDLIVDSLPQLLDEIDGRVIEKGGQRWRLETADAPVRRLEMPALRQILSVLANPSLAAILMSLGFLGIYFEFMNPGSYLPGIVGALCLILAFLGLSILPFNAAGIALILLAVALFVAEVKVASFGLLTLAGVVSLVLGALVLFKDAGPAIRVSNSALISIAATALLVVGSLMVLVLRAHRRPASTGRDGLVGARGKVTSALDPDGKVFVQGEIWNATAETPVADRQPVEVIAVEGMLLRVRPLSSTSSPEAS
ncbi:MAG: nodulation protein NfeD [Acidobacteriota bacterium]